MLTTCVGLLVTPVQPHLQCCLSQCLGSYQESGASDIDTVHCAKCSIATEGTTDNIEDGVSGVSQPDLERVAGGIRNEKDF